LTLNVNTLGYGLHELGRINSESDSIDCAILTPKQMGFGFSQRRMENTGSDSRNPDLDSYKIRIPGVTGSSDTQRRSLGTTRDLYLRITLQPVRTELKRRLDRQSQDVTVESPIENHGAAFRATGATLRVNVADRGELISVNEDGDRHVTSPARCLEPRLRTGQREPGVVSAPNGVEILRAQ
jgi:hypothetical protein